MVPLDRGIATIEATEAAASVKIKIQVELRSLDVGMHPGLLK